MVCRAAEARPATSGQLVLGGVTACSVGAVLARRPGVSPLERRCYRALNGLPGAAFPPAWVVMQLGSLGGPLVPAVGALRAGRPDLARRIVLAGGVTWSGARLVKRAVRRARPGAATELSRVLGREQRGLGYPSGHAAVAASVAAVAAPEAPPPWRPVLWALAALVGACRVYVGAHLPLDVAGGLTFGAAVGGALRGFAVTGRG